MDGPCYLHGPDAYTPAWYAMRKYNPRRKPPVVFGASEAAAVCGLSKYATPLEIYLRKRGEIGEIEENDAMRLGKLLEPVVLSEYERRTSPKRTERNLPMLVHKKYQHIGATLDLLAWDNDSRETADGRCVDAKTTSFRRAEEFGEEWTDEIPDDYLLQLQQQMLVTGCQSADLAVLLDGRTLRCYRVEANDVLQQAIVDATSELLERIISHDPPEPTWNHASTNKLLKEIYGLNSAQEVILSDHTALVRQQYETLGEDIKDLKEQQEELQNIILHAMGDAGIGLLPDGSKLVRGLVNVKAAMREAYSYTKITKRKPPKEKA